jgi:CubicO group peptidase (beta-lactamase class C family)
MKVGLIGLFFLLLQSTVFAKTIGKTPSEVEHFVDTFIEQNKQNVAGGVITWFDNHSSSETSFAKPFGVTNLNHKTPISPENTQFRIASVSKVITAIAASKLVEAGLLELDVSIDMYLDAKVTKQLIWPVTMKQLLTHTAGFEDKFYGDLTLFKDQQESLQNHLANSLPRQIYQPGEIVAYSNYGNALAALVIENIVNMPFSLYVNKSILMPLGMNKTSYSINSEKPSHLATGYKNGGSGFELQPYTYVHRYPATSMVSTAVDMNKLIQALVTENTVITPFMQSLLFKTHFSHHQELAGMGLAFMEFDRFGQKGWWHDGSHFGYQAELVIMPELQSGFFIVSNTSNSNFTGKLRFDLYAFLFDKNENQELNINKLTNVDITKYEGTYQNSRRNQTTFEALKSLFSKGVKVEASNDHLLLFGAKYYPVKEHVFMEESIGHKLVFKAEDQNVTHLFVDWGGAPRALLKQNPLKQQFVQLPLVGGILVLSMLFMAFHIRDKSATQPKAVRFLSLVPNILMLIFSVALVGYFYSLSAIDIRAGQIAPLLIILSLPIIAVLVQAFLVWKIGIKNLSKWQTGLFFVFLLSLMYFTQYNMIGFWL